MDKYYSVTPCVNELLIGYRLLMNPMRLNIKWFGVTHTVRPAK